MADNGTQGRQVVDLGAAKQAAYHSEPHWPAGREETLAFAHELLAYPVGFPLMNVTMAAQTRMQQNRAPKPHPGDALVVCGLAEAVNGYLVATPALRAAAMLFAPDEESVAS